MINNDKDWLDKKIEKLNKGDRQTEPYDNRLDELETAVKTLDAEEIVINRITREASERVEKKADRRNFIALVLALIANIGSFNFIIPQTKKNIETEVNKTVERNVEEEVDRQVEEAIEEQKVEEKVEEIEDSLQRLKLEETDSESTIN